MHSLGLQADVSSASSGRGFSISDSSRNLAAAIFDELRATSSSGLGISRETYGRSETQAFELIERYASEAGLEVSWDPARNMRVRLPGSDTDLPSVATGSHMDSVPEGGNYDGAAGVVAGLVVLLEAQRNKERKRSMDLYALRGEESAWFGGPCYFGSRAMFGQLSETDFNSPHRDGGKTLADSMRESGADVPLLQTGAVLFDPSSMHRWFELHIEQGPVLIARDKPVGIVTGIRGNHRHRRVTCKGEAAHSGAVPRWLRHDAVMALSDLMVRIDEHWRVLLEWGEDLVVTAGIVQTNSDEHAISRVPGDISFALEYRSQDIKTLKSFENLIQSECENVDKKRGVEFDLGTPSLTLPAKMAPEAIEALTHACDEHQTPYEVMASGAGHDSSVFANAGIPSGMVFVRNDKGSHNPHEAMELEDFYAATNVLGSAMVAEAKNSMGDR